jgi:hypothetical protein
MRPKDPIVQLKYEAIAQRMILSQGQNERELNRAICEEFGCTRQYLANLKKDPRFIEVFERVKKELQQPVIRTLVDELRRKQLQTLDTFHHYFVESLKTQYKMMKEAKKEEVRLKASQALQQAYIQFTQPIKSQSASILQQQTIIKPRVLSEKETQRIIEVIKEAEEDKKKNGKN